MHSEDDFMTLQEAFAWAVTGDPAFSRHCASMRGLKFAFAISDWSNRNAGKPQRFANGIEHLFQSECAKGQILAAGVQGIANRDRQPGQDKWNFATERTTIKPGEWSRLILGYHGAEPNDHHGDCYRELIFSRPDVLRQFRSPAELERLHSAVEALRSGQLIGAETESAPSPKRAVKGSAAEAYRAWQNERADVAVGKTKRRPQKVIEADYPKRYHVSRMEVRLWIKGANPVGRPRADRRKSQHD
jgi:hypothetical protein